MDSKVDILLRILQNALPDVDTEELIQAIRTLIRDEQAQVQGNTIKLSLGQGNTINESNLTIRDIVGGDINHFNLNFPALSSLNPKIRQIFFNNLYEWLNILGYHFTAYHHETDHHSEWIIEERTRRGSIKIFVYSTTSMIRAQDVQSIRSLITYHECDEGWIVTSSIVDKLAQNESNQDKNKTIFCYSFDELIEETIDFSNYFDWLNQEVKSKNIDQRYISLGCEKSEYDERTQQLIARTSYEEEDGWIDGYINSWLNDSRKEHLSILGEFGTGKTWFTLHYSWILLQEYENAKRKNLPRPRIPIFIALRDFAKSVEVEALISDFFFRKHKIEIKGVFDAFMHLNKMGKILIIFDGFDEMADKVNKQKMIDNFWTLATIIKENSKVILTCRNEHFPQIKDGRELLSSKLRQTTKHLSGISPQFEIIQIKKLNDNQINTILSHYTNKNTIERIMAYNDVNDLLSRPIMIELIIDALSSIEDGGTIDITHIYFFAIHRKMERDITQYRTFTSLSDKLYFLCELSLYMIENDKLSVNYREFPSIVSNLFTHIGDHEIDYWRYDMHGQTLLIIDEDGQYKPAHKSFIEFFVAYKFCAQLGLLLDEFANIARLDLIINKDIPQSYTWEEYFSKKSRDNFIVSKPLLNFSVSDFNILKDSLGGKILTKTIIDFLVQMIKIDIAIPVLYELLDKSRYRYGKDINFLASNLILIITTIQPNFFKHGDLSYLELSHFSFQFDERSFYSRKIDFSYANFTGSNLTKANIQSHPYFRTINKMNLQNTILKDFYFTTSQIDTLIINDEFQEIIVFGPDVIILLDKSFFVKKVVVDNKGSWKGLLINQDVFIHSSLNSYKLRNPRNLKYISRFILSKQYNESTAEPENPWNSDFKLINNKKTLIVARNNSFIHFIDIENELEIKILKCPNTVRSISVSFDERYLLAVGHRYYILWDIITNEQVYSLYNDKSKNITSISAKFHQKYNIFIEYNNNNNEIKIFNIDDISNPKVINVNFEINDYIISRDNYLIIISGNKIILFDIESSMILNEYTPEININKNTMSDLYIEYPHINKIYTNINEDTIFAIINHRYIISIDIKSMKLTNSYLSLPLFFKTDIRESKGIDSDILDYLRMNGAIC